MKRIVEDGQPKLLISWNDYHRETAVLAKRIEDKLGRRPDQIVAILTGGVIVAKILRSLWGDKVTLFGVIAVQSYDGHEPRPDHNVFFKRKILNTGPALGNDWLLVDDLTESGRTLRLTKAFVQKDFSHTFKTLTVATLFHKATSAFEPDCYAQRIEAETCGKCPWIVQPFDGPVPIAS
jgi:hypoxanthine phosphoribosyltransferase